MCVCVCVYYSCTDTIVSPPPVDSLRSAAQPTERPFFPAAMMPPEAAPRRASRRLGRRVDARDLSPQAGASRPARAAALGARGAVLSRAAQLAAGCVPRRCCAARPAALPRRPSPAAKCGCGSATTIPTITKGGTAAHLPHEPAPAADQSAPTQSSRRRYRRHPNSTGRYRRPRRAARQAATDGGGLVLHRQT